MANRRDSMPGFGLMLLLLGCIAGPLFLSIAVQELVWATASTAWPTAPGSIESTRIAHHNRYDVPIAHYTFVIGEKKYGGSILGCDLDRYPVGKLVTVYYSPNNPRNNRLVPGATRHTWLGLLPGLGLVSLGILGIYLVAIRPGNQRNPTDGEAMVRT